MKKYNKETSISFTKVDEELIKATPLNFFWEDKQETAKAEMVAKNIPTPAAWNNL